MHGENKTKCLRYILSYRIIMTFHEYENKNNKIKSSFVRPGSLWLFEFNKTGFDLLNPAFNIRRKLSVIRYDK